jgi:hypothetical protein
VLADKDAAAIAIAKLGSFGKSIPKGAT